MDGDSDSDSERGWGRGKVTVRVVADRTTREDEGR